MKAPAKKVIFLPWSVFMPCQQSAWRLNNLVDINLNGRWSHASLMRHEPACGKQAPTMWEKSAPYVYAFNVGQLIYKTPPPHRLDRIRWLENKMDIIYGLFNDTQYRFTVIGGSTKWA